MQSPWTCGSPITSMAVCRTTVHGVDQASHAIREASLTLTGSAPVAVMGSIRKPIQTIHSSSIPNHRTARCNASTCARVAASAFVLGPSPPDAVAAVEEAVAAAVAVVKAQRQRHLPKPVRRTRRLSSQRWQRPRVLAVLVALGSSGSLVSSVCPDCLQHVLRLRGLLQCLRRQLCAPAL